MSWMLPYVKEGTSAAVPTKKKRPHGELARSAKRVAKIDHLRELSMEEAAMSSNPTVQRMSDKVTLSRLAGSIEKWVDTTTGKGNSGQDLATSVQLHSMSKLNLEYIDRLSNLAMALSNDKLDEATRATLQNSLRLTQESIDSIQKEIKRIERMMADNERVSVYAHEARRLDFPPTSPTRSSDLPPSSRVSLHSDDGGSEYSQP